MYVNNACETKNPQIIRSFEVTAAGVTENKDLIDAIIFVLNT